MTLCAWCNAVIGRFSTDATGAVAISHGLCRACLSAELARLRPTVQTPTLFVVEPPRG
jgi:hypothetical protein